MNIYDIAKKADVSIATVSRVLNSSEHVSEKTREKVLQVMKNSDYVPNAFARGLGLNTMRMIGVMCTDVTDTFYANAVGHIEKLFREKGMDIVLCCTGNNLEDKKKKLSYLVNRRVDAVVLIGSAFKEEKDNSHIAEAAAQIPVIIVNGYIKLPNVYCVVCDERKAMEKNISYLQKAGCSRILYLYDTLTYSGNEKLSGYKAGCEKYFNTVDESLILKVNKNIEAISKVVTVLYKKGIYFDAVTASEDILAAGALNAINKLNVDIPVIGFNNSVIAECTSPALTSVDNMLEAMCEAAVKILSDLEGRKNVPNKTLISSRLHERESFKKL